MRQWLVRRVRVASTDPEGGDDSMPRREGGRVCYGGGQGLILLGSGVMGLQPSRLCVMGRLRA